MCALLPHRALADKEGCLEDFLPVQNKEKEDREQKPIFPIFSGQLHE